jgi:hypothetical protein
VRGPVETSELCFDEVGRFVRIDVLPESQHGPARRRQELFRVVVAESICSELERPPVPVGYRLGPVCGTAVPEAAIDENGELAPGERDVNRAPVVTRHTHEDAETPATLVQLASE